MPQQWDLVKQGNNGVTYYKQGNSSGAMVPRQPQQPVQFAAQNGGRRFEYIGPDNSYVTEMALGIAERVMDRRCQSSSDYP